MIKLRSHLKIHWSALFSILVLDLLLLFIPAIAEAQTSSVNFGSSRQEIRGFGGMNFPRWIGDLSTAQVDRAFGNGSGQIGLTIMRIDVPPNSGDWSGQVAAAQRAKSNGAIVFATPWSPPASMKTNGSTVGGSLSTSSYGAYANHLRDFANYMSSNGASLYAISVQNEPDYIPDYESCGWSASQMRTFLNNNASVIPVRVIAPETVHPKSDWYSTLSSSSQLDIYADHLYGGSPTSFSKEHWMTEHYTNSGISGNQWPDALDAGIEVANCMANNYSAYIWWYVRRSYGLLDESGNVTKRGYVMSHFSKFVRPGYIRVDATYQPASNVYITAYKNGDDVVIVAINRNSSSRSVTFNLSGGEVSSFTKYETTSSSNVSNRGSVSGGSSMTNSLSGYSISTFTGTIGGGGGGGDEYVWLEAECGNVGSLWNTPSDGNASEGTYVTIQSGNNSTSSAPSSSSGQITYPFDVIESGNYIVWGRVIAPNGNDDSFWIRMDSGSWIKWNNIASGSSWHWDEVHDADNSNQLVNYNLDSGSHTLTVAYREDGTQLDKIFITNSGDTPSGTGSTATNCGGPQNQPPVADAGSNQTVTDSDNSGSETVSLNGSNSYDPDGSIVSYVWTESGNQIATGQTPSVSLSVGTHSITLTVTDNDNATDTDGVTVTVNAGSTGGDVDIWLEAECGTVGSLWNSPSDGSASNNQYVTIQSGNNSTSSAPSSSSGYITYGFSVGSSDSYVLWARVIAPSPNDDSFWIRMDGGSWYMWNNISPSSSWTWDDCQSYSLSSGSHTLTVAYREDGTQLDKIYITNSGDTPSGEGSAADNCSGGGGGGTVLVRARGNTGNESIELRLNDNTVQTWNLTTSYQSFTYNTSLTSANIKVYFNDSGGGSNDVQIDYIQVNGTTLQAENQATNTGVWQDGGCGGSYSEWIHCEGYIDFGTRTIGSEAVKRLPNENLLVPTEFVLKQNFPNPFNPVTEIDYQIPYDSHVVLTVYDVNGARVRKLVNQHQAPGQYSVTWNAVDDHGNPVSAGVYFYKILVFTDNEIQAQSRKMILMK